MNGLYGAFCLLIGTVFLFLGIKMFRTVLASTGFIIGCLATFVLLTNLRTHTSSWGPHGDTVILSVALVVGLVGAMLGLQLWMAALVAVGGLAGFSVVLYCLTLRGDGRLEARLLHSGALYLLSGTVLGAIAAVLYERVVIILGTSIIGAMLFSSGLDVFLETGFNQMMQAVLKGRGTAHLPPAMVSKLYVLLGSAAVLAFLGVLVQACITKPDPQKP